MKMSFDPPTSHEEVLKIYRQAIRIRSLSPARGTDIARAAFDITRPSDVVLLTPTLERLRFEVGALEAPGSPPEGVSISTKQYDKLLWDRFARLVADASASQSAGDTAEEVNECRDPPTLL